jgi:Na+/H+ antiporter NhaA
MKWQAVTFAALTPFAFLNSGVFLGHALVLLVTLGIFFGTLSLGKSPGRTAGQADRSLTS